MLDLHFLYSPNDRTWKKEQTGKEAIINLEGLCKWPPKCTILKSQKLNSNKNLPIMTIFAGFNDHNHVTMVSISILDLHGRLISTWLILPKTICQWVINIDTVQCDIDMVSWEEYHKWNTFVKEKLKF